MPAPRSEQTEADHRNAPVQSVDRALQVLEVLGELGTAGASEIAPALGVHKSTVSRLLASLEMRGFVEQTEVWGKYRLGFSLARLAGLAMSQVDLARVGQQACDELASSIGETANLAILDGPRAINLTEGRSDAVVALRSWVGQGSPAHATSSGKSLLLDHSLAALNERLGSPLEQHTARTLTDPQQLLADLQASRERGWTSVEEELEVGLNAVAAPVHDHLGHLVAAVSVSGPAYRLEPARFDEVGAVVRGAARQVSERLGAPVPRS
ncbi:IclR family transcriptional regulator [Dermacoccaceae bacterium W4C1]